MSCGRADLGLGDTAPAGQHRSTGKNCVRPLKLRPTNCMQNSNQDKLGQQRSMALGEFRPKQGFLFGLACVGLLVGLSPCCSRLSGMSCLDFSDRLA